MDFNAIIESLTAIVRHSGSAVVVYAVVVCILTEIVKKLFIPKLKIDLLNKFDPTIIVPFALGCAASVFHSLAVQGVDLSSAFENVLVNGLTIGATSTVLYRMFVSVFCENVKKLKKEFLSYTSNSKKSINPELAYCIHRQLTIRKRRIHDIFVDYINGKLDGYNHKPTITDESDFIKYYRRVVNGIKIG